MSDSASSPTQPASPVPGDPHIGALIGDRYRVLNRLGEGGMGAVYRAEHILMKKTVAIKLLHGELGQVDDAIRRFEREAQSASRLGHPNIIAVTDFGRASSGELYLVMEYVKGEPLGDVLAREKRLSLRRALAILRQILAALEHAHREGVVHRDLKPANIMLARDPETGEERVKILDFGIAKMSQGLDGDQPLTKTAMVFGTPSYMSPEQATAQEADARSDLYACGIMLYEMVLGRKPFVAEDLVKVMAMQVTQPPPPFAHVAPDLALPPALEAAVSRALEKDRTRRFQSASEFAAALAGLEGHKGVRTALARFNSLARPFVGEVRGVYVRLPWKVRRWTPAASVLGVVALLVLIPTLCGRSGPAPTAAPPPPKPVEPALKTHLQRVEEAMARGRLPEARVMLLKLLSENPKTGRVHHLLGHLEFVDRKPRAGLDAYGEALRFDPGLRGDVALLVNVKAALADKTVARDALDMLIEKIGTPAAATIAQIASDDPRAEFRKAGRDGCAKLGCTAKVDLVSSYTLDLKQPKATCEEKREAVRNLAATGNPRAIDPLKRARRDRNPFAGLFGGGNDCIRKDVEAALKSLGAS